MADPVKYIPGYSYSGWQASNPTRPLPAAQVDNDLANIETSIDEIVDAITDVRRSDGALKNGIVTEDSLAPDVQRYLDAAADAVAAQVLADGLTADVLAELPWDPRGTGFGAPFYNNWANTFRPEQYGAAPWQEGTPTEKAERLTQMGTEAVLAGKEIFIPLEDDVYEIDTPIGDRTWNGIRGNIDGEIYNSNPVSLYGGQSQAVFKAGSFHPTYWGRDGSEVIWYDAGAVVRGQTYFIVDPTDKAAMLADFAVGTVFYGRGSSHYLSSSVEIPDFEHTTKIVAIDATTGRVDIADPFDEDCPDLIVGNTYQPGVLDLMGNPIFCASDWQIGGKGIIRAIGSPLTRTATWGVNLKGAKLKGETCYYGANFCRSVFDFTDIEASIKFADISASSQHSRFIFEYAKFIGAGEASTNLFLISENSRDCTVEGQLLQLPDYAQNSAVLAMLVTRGSAYRIRNIDAPKTTAGLISVTNQARTVSGELVQPRTHDNTIEIDTIRGPAAGGFTRFLRGDNAGGQLKRTNVKINRIYGAPATDVALLSGTEWNLDIGYIETVAKNVILDTGFTGKARVGQGVVSYASGYDRHIADVEVAGVRGKDLAFRATEGVGVATAVTLNVDLQNGYNQTISGRNNLSTINIAAPTNAVAGDRLTLVIENNSATGGPAALVFNAAYDLGAFSPAALVMAKASRFYFECYDTNKFVLVKKAAENYTP